MRLASLVMVALLAGCVGPIQVNDAPKTEGSTAVDETGSATVEPGRPAQSSNGSPDAGERRSEPRSGPMGNGSVRQVPPALHWEGTFTVAADAGAITGTPCDALSSCDHRSFTIDGTFDLEATLSWGLAANDFDLYLFQDGAEVSRDGIDETGELPSTSQVLVHEALAPGAYELWVVGSRMVLDSYELDAVFALPRDPTQEPPAPMHWGGDYNQVAIPAVGPWNQCGVPLTACFSHDFSILGTFDLEATLSWVLPTNDLDLYLYRHVSDRTYAEVDRAGADGTDVPTTQQILRQPELAPGNYRFLVVPQHGVRTEYELDAVLSAVTT